MLLKSDQKKLTFALSFRLRCCGTQLNFFVGKILDFVERGSLTHPRSVGVVKRQSVCGSYMTSVFMNILQGRGQKGRGWGGRNERWGRAKTSVRYALQPAESRN